MLYVGSLLLSLYRSSLQEDPHVSVARSSSDRTSKWMVCCDQVPKGRRTRWQQEVVMHMSAAVNNDTHCYVVCNVGLMSLFFGIYILFYLELGAGTSPSAPSQLRPDPPSASARSALCKAGPYTYKSTGMHIPHTCLKQKIFCAFILTYLLLSNVKISLTNTIIKLRLKLSKI